MRNKCIFLQQFWSFVLFSFCIWFYVFAPGSHCFAIDILNRSAICPSPLLIDLNCSSQIFNLQNLGRQQSNCSKNWTPKKSNLKKKKSEFHLPNWIFQTLFFPTFFHMFHFVSHFFPSVFSTRIFFTFFSKRIFSTCFHIFVKKMWKRAFWKCDFQEHMKKMRFENVKKHVNKMVQKWEQKAVDGSWKVPVFLAHFPFFFSPDIGVFSGFLWKPMLNS